MIPNNTSKTLGPIETNIVARLTYEKKTIVTVEELDQLFIFLLRIENRSFSGLKRRRYSLLLSAEHTPFLRSKPGQKEQGLTSYLSHRFSFLKRTTISGIRPCSIISV